MLNPSFSSHSSSLHRGETIPPMKIRVGVRGPGELAADEVGLRSDADVVRQDIAGGIGVKKAEGESYALGENWCVLYAGGVLMMRGVGRLALAARWRGVGKGRLGGGV